MGKLTITKNESTTSSKKVVVTDTDKSILWNACIRAYSHGQEGLENYLNENIASENQFMGIKVLFEQYMMALGEVIDQVLIEKNQVSDEDFPGFCDHIMSLGQSQYDELIGAQLEIPKEIYAQVKDSKKILHMILTNPSNLSEQNVDIEKFQSMRNELITKQRWRLLNKNDPFLYDEQGKFRKAQFSFRNAFQKQIDRFQSF